MMTMKKTIKLLGVIIFLLILNKHPLEAFAEPSNPITYQPEVKVKLVPSSSFTLTILGDYQVVDIETNSVIPVSEPISISQENGVIFYAYGKQTGATTNGLNIQEIRSSDANEVIVSTIKTVYGPKDVHYRGSLEIRPGESSPLLFNRLDIESYVQGVVPNEMPASWPLEALKAQAVAARTYAYTQMTRNKTKGYLEMTVASQVYGGKSSEHSRSNQAVAETKGIYALYNNVPIDAVFHSSSGGHTEHSENVWLSSVPYLRGVNDPFDQHSNNYHYDWKTTATTANIKQRLNLTDDQMLLDLRISERGVSQAVTNMEAVIFDHQTDSTSIISLKPTFVPYPDRFRSFFGVTLKSTKFSITSDATTSIQLADGSVVETNYLTGYSMMDANGAVQKIKHEIQLPVKLTNGVVYVPTYPQSFTFSGDGWGHLLGMSQWGARGMAEQGYTFKDILKHYYTGIDVKTWNPS
jgi:stage II sporulation protein D